MSTQIDMGRVANFILRGLNFNPAQLEIVQRILSITELDDIKLLNDMGEISTVVHTLDGSYIANNHHTPKSIVAVSGSVLPELHTPETIEKLVKKYGLGFCMHKPPILNMHGKTLPYIVVEFDAGKSEITGCGYLGRVYTIEIGHFVCLDVLQKK